MRKRHRLNQKRRSHKEPRERKLDRKWRRDQEKRRARERERNGLLKRVMPMFRRAAKLSVNGNARAVFGDVDPHKELEPDPDTWTFSVTRPEPRKPGILCTPKGVYANHGAFKVFDRPWNRLTAARLRELLNARWVPDEPKDAVTALGELA